MGLKSRSKVQAKWVQYVELLVRKTRGPIHGRAGSHPQPFFFVIPCTRRSHLAR